MSVETVGKAAGFVFPVTAVPGLFAKEVKDTIDRGNDAKAGQRDLEARRKKELEDQVNARAAAAAKAATSGQRAGLRGQFNAGAGALGFGSGSTAPGLSSGRLFGN